MSAPVHDRVAVYTVFNDSREKLRPVKFRWRNRVCAIKEITYAWETRHGSTTCRHFAASDGANLYELVFNTTALTWELCNVQPLNEL